MTCEFCETAYTTEDNARLQFGHNVEMEPRFAFNPETCGVETLGILAYATALNIVVVIRDGFANRHYAPGLYEIPDKQEGNDNCTVAYVISVIKRIENGDIIAQPVSYSRNTSREQPAT